MPVHAINEPLWSGSDQFFQALRSLFVQAERRTDAFSPPGTSKCIDVIWTGDSMTDGQCAYNASGGNFKIPAFNNAMAAYLNGASRTQWSMCAANFGGVPPVFGCTHGLNSASANSLVTLAQVPETHRHPGAGFVMRNMSRRVQGTEDNSSFSFHPNNSHMEPTIHDIGSMSQPAGGGNKIVMPATSVGFDVITVSSPTYDDILIDGCPYLDDYASSAYAITAFETKTVSKTTDNPEMVTGTIMAKKNSVVLAKNAQPFMHARVHGPAGVLDGAGARLAFARFNNPDESFGCVANHVAKAGYLASSIPNFHNNSQYLIEKMGCDLLLVEYGINEAHLGVTPAAFAASVGNNIAWFRAAFGKPNLPALVLNCTPKHDWATQQQKDDYSYQFEAIRTILVAADPLVGTLNMRRWLNAMDINETTQGYPGTGGITPVAYTRSLGAQAQGTYLYWQEDVDQFMGGAAVMPNVSYEVRLAAGVQPGTPFFQSPQTYPQWYRKRWWYRFPEPVYFDRTHLSIPGQSFAGASVAKLLAGTFGSGSMLGGGGGGGSGFGDGRVNYVVA